MNKIMYDNKPFLQFDDMAFAVRPHKSDRWEILTWVEDGELQCKSRTVKPDMFKALKSIFKERGLA
jgi:hypothetical protein